MESEWTRVDGIRMHARVLRSAAPIDTTPQNTTVADTTAHDSTRNDTAAHDAPPIVLVHGLGAASGYMMPVAAQLAKNFRVYVPDLPGFGESDKPRHALNLPELAGALSQWMDTMGLPEAPLLGNSMGCQIIAELALSDPDRVTHAILQGPTVDPRARSMVRQAFRLFKDWFFEPPSLPPIVLRDYWKCGSRRLVRTFRYALHDPIEEKLRRMHVPTLIVRGGRDPIVPQRWAEQAARLLSDGRLVVVPAAAHAMNYSHPAKLAEIVRRFVTTPSPA